MNIFGIIGDEARDNKVKIVEKEKMKKLRYYILVRIINLKDPILAFNFFRNVHRLSR